MGWLQSDLVRASATIGPPAGAGSGSRGSLHERLWLPLDLSVSHQIMMPILINGVEVIAEVDTGSSRSVIKGELAKRLGLLALGSTRATTFTNTVIGNLFEIDQISLGGVGVSRIEAASYGSQEAHLMESLADVSFTIGQDILKYGFLEIDFPGKRVRFSSSLSRKSYSDKLSLKEGITTVLSVPITFEGEREQQAILDTGSALPLSISHRMALACGLLDNRPSSTSLTVGAEGAKEATIITSKMLQLGPFVLKDIPTCIIKDWKLDRDINIGWPLLASFGCAFDLRDRQIFLHQDAAAAKVPLPKDRSGIGAIRLADRIVVRHIGVNSPAEKAGLEVDDEIISIDNVVVDAFNPVPGERIGVKPAGTLIDLGLKNGKHIKLVLADYF